MYDAHWSQIFHTEMGRREERDDGQATRPSLYDIGQVVYGVLILSVRAIGVVDALIKVILVLFVVVGLCEIGGGMHTGRKLARRAMRRRRRRAKGLLKTSTALFAVAGGEHGPELERAR